MNTGIASIGAVFHTYRERRQISARDVASALQISTGHSYALESGARLPSPSLAVALCVFLGIPMSEALPVLMANETRCSTLCELGDALVSQRFLREARVVWNAATNLNASMYNSRYAGRVYHGQGKVAYLLGDYSEAAEWFLRMLRAAKRDPNSHRVGVAYYDYAQTLRALGEQVQALEMYAVALRSFARRREVFEMGAVHQARGLLLLEGGFYKDALRDFRSGSHCFRGLANRHLEALLGVGAASLGLNRPDEAEQALVAASRDCEVPGDEGRVLMFMAVVERQRGDLEGARLHVSRALERFGPAEAAQAARQETLLEAAVLEGLRGDRTAAARYLSEAFAGGPIKDINDASVAHVLSACLGVAGHPGLASLASLHDDYTKRTAAALAVLTTDGHPGSGLLVIRPGAASVSSRSTVQDRGL